MTRAMRASTPEEAAQIVLDAQGYVIFGSHTERSIGETVTELAAWGSRNFAPTVKIIGEATLEEAKEQARKFGYRVNRFSPFHYKVVAE
jgi:hypothetical protein